MEDRALAVYGCFRSPKGKRSKPVFNPAELSAAKSLILLAHSSGGFCPKVSTISLPINSTIFHREKYKETSSAAAAPTAQVKSQKSVSPDTPLPTYNSVNPQDSVSTSSETYANPGDAVAAAMIVNEKEPLSAETAPLVRPSNNSARHDCKVCGKNFKSHQALGGHMTMHRSKPQTAAAAEDGGSRNPSAESGGDHECSFCHERYPNGQALGGHKRKHFEGIIGNAANSQAKHVAGERLDGGATTPAIIRPKICLKLRLPKSTLIRTVQKLEFD